MKITEQELAYIVKESVNEILDRLGNDGNSKQADYLAMLARKRGYNDLADRLEGMRDYKHNHGDHGERYEYGDNEPADFFGSIPDTLTAPITAGGQLPKFGRNEISEAVKNAMDKVLNQ